MTVVQPDHETLPSFYWLPKVHKTLYGSRFIAASSRCTTKKLSAILTACFRTVLTHYKQYWDGTQRRSGVNCFLGNGELDGSAGEIKRINGMSKARCFDT